MNAAPKPKRPMLKSAAALSALGVMLSLGGAQAQIQGSQPVAVTSAGFDYVGGIATYSGQVQAIQGQTRLNCSELRIYRTGPAGGNGALSGGGEVSRYECSGPVYYVTPTEQARGDAAVFTAATDTIVMTGNVTVRQGLNVAQGHRLTINTRTRNTRLESSGAAPRVRTVIYPEDEPGGTPRPATAATPAR